MNKYKKLWKRIKYDIMYKNIKYIKSTIDVINRRMVSTEEPIN